MSHPRRLLFLIVGPATIAFGFLSAWGFGLLAWPIILVGIALLSVGLAGFWDARLFMGLAILVILIYIATKI